jgi:hypothetical protein
MTRTPTRSTDCLMSAAYAFPRHPIVSVIVNTVSTPVMISPIMATPTARSEAMIGPGDAAVMLW